MIRGSVALTLLGLSAACGATNDTMAVTRGSVSGCPGPDTASGGVVSLFTFEHDEERTQVADLVSGHNGSVQLGPVVTIDGPERCGRAFSFGATGQYIVIDDNPVWDMEVGSVDLWFWLPAQLSDHIGVLSRDLAHRDAPGHFSLFIDSEGRAIVRVQPQDASTDHSADAVSCSATPLPREQWVHLGVTFGPPAVELYVDGQLEQWKGANAITSDWACGQPGAFGIAGNDLPWVIGRSAYASAAPLQGLTFPAYGCALAYLRISNQRRDFATLFRAIEH